MCRNSRWTKRQKKNKSNVNCTFEIKFVYEFVCRLQALQFYFKKPSLSSLIELCFCTKNSHKIRWYKIELKAFAYRSQRVTSKWKVVNPNRWESELRQHALLSNWSNYEPQFRAYLLTLFIFTCHTMLRTVTRKLNVMWWYFSAISLQTTREAPLDVVKWSRAIQQKKTCVLKHRDRTQSQQHSNHNRVLFFRAHTNNIQITFSDISTHCRQEIW